MHKFIFLEADVIPLKITLLDTQQIQRIKADQIPNEKKKKKIVNNE